VIAKVSSPLSPRSLPSFTTARAIVPPPTQTASPVTRVVLVEVGATVTLVVDELGAADELVDALAVDVVGELEVDDDVVVDVPPVVDVDGALVVDEVDGGREVLLGVDEEVVVDVGGAEELEVDEVELVDVVAGAAEVLVVTGGSWSSRTSWTTWSASWRSRWTSTSGTERSRCWSSRRSSSCCPARR
jgi:hypothetical protein